MVGKYTNSFLANNTIVQRRGEILFFQKMIEQLHRDTPISDSYRIHNAYTIMKELYSVIQDYHDEKINGIALIEILNETREMFDDELIIKQNDPSFYASIKAELKRTVKIDNNQTFDSISLNNISSIYHAISIVFDKYKPIDYQQQCINLLKVSVDLDDRKEITSLCQCLISCLLHNGRSVRNLYNDIRFYFETDKEDFDIRWSRWVATLLRYDSEYCCLIELPQAAAFCENKSVIEGKAYKNELECSGLQITGLEKILEEKKYFLCQVKSPTDDIGYILKTAFSKILPVIAVIDFSSDSENLWSQFALIYDIHRRVINFVEYDPSPYQFRPYKQYRQAIHATVDKMLENFKNRNSEDYSKILRSVACISSLQIKNLEYNYLILWSATETLFKSKQTTTTIASIKTVVPHILTQRYVYYLVFDLIKNCGYCKVRPVFESTCIATDTPKDEDVANMCQLLRDPDEASKFIKECETQYLLLSEQAKELQDILSNAYSIKQKNESHLKTLSYNLQRMYRVRNKFVHHSEIDSVMEALYKHLIVYLWESIRELSYVSNKNSNYTLEELFAYFRIGHTTLMNKLRHIGAGFDFDLLKWEY